MNEELRRPTRDDHGVVSDELRSPALDDRGRRVLDRLRQHPHAPRWNHEAGDRLKPSDLEALDALREDLRALRRPRRSVPEEIIAWVLRRREVVPLFRARVPVGFALDRDWAEVPTSCREDVALRPEQLVPEDANLEELIAYRTAGTTGHALVVPHHPRAAASYLPLLELALTRWGLAVPSGPDAITFNVGAQRKTVTYPTVLTAWDQAGFAKLNLSAAEWPAPESARRYFEDLAPALLTGDPTSFAELARLEIPARPRALLTTAVAMSRGLAAKLEERFDCPVIDWYSLTETGPLAYGCPKTEAYHLLPHDVFVEVLDPAGRPVSEGDRGEVTVTGGRNPFLPLLRYRTGDWGRLEHAPCPCGDPMPRLVDLEGRRPVLFRGEGGGLVNPVDVSRVLRPHPFVAYALEQHADSSLTLTLRPVPHTQPDTGRLERELLGLFGALALEVRFDAELGTHRDEKHLPYRSALLLED